MFGQVSASHQSCINHTVPSVLLSLVLSGKEGEFFGRKPPSRVDEGSLAKRGSCFREIKLSMNCMLVKQIESRIASLVREVNFVDYPVSFWENKGNKLFLFQRYNTFIFSSKWTFFFFLTECLTSAQESIIALKSMVAV